MSCRVLKRDMEIAMLDSLVERARQKGVKRLVGYFLPTAKNEMVADHYEKLGFSSIPCDAVTGTVWELELAAYEPRSCHIRILERTNA
jgi:predicted enzyme involved in methoxymalonyl-ACP biosynthesis